MAAASCLKWSRALHGVRPPPPEGIRCAHSTVALRERTRRFPKIYCANTSAVYEPIVCARKTYRAHTVPLIACAKTCGAHTVPFTNRSPVPVKHTVRTQYRSRSENAFSPRAGPPDVAPSLAMFLGARSRFRCAPTAHVDRSVAETSARASSRRTRQSSQVHGEFASALASACSSAFSATTLR